MKQVGNFYWKTDRIVDQKMDRLEIIIWIQNSYEDESDTETDSDDDARLLIVI